jgi:GntR family transcriptional repressor for pyruvate dehydrogenase complex
MSTPAAARSPRPLRALPRARLIDRAAEAIKDYVLANHLRRGDRLPSEAELARSLGVSRNVIRQAVSSLETLGILQVAQGRGIYVGDVADTTVFRQLASWLNTNELDNQEFIQARAIFERGIFELVLARISDAELDQLAAIAAALRDASAEEEIQRLHDEFHQALLAATGNRFLMTLGTILNRFFWSVAYSGPHVHRVSPAYLRESHAQLVELLRRRRVEDIPAMIALHLGVPRG